MGRHIVRALVVALVVATLAAFGASRLATDSTATSRVAVSDEIGWPFYTTARDSLLAVALDPVLQDEVRQAVGADETTLELTAALTGGEISVDLSARSADAAVATEAANLFATEVVRRGTQEVRADAEGRLAELQADLQSIDERTAVNEAELVRLGAVLDDVVAPPGDGTRLVLESQIRRLDSAMAEDARRRTQIVQILPPAGAAVEAPSDYEFVRTARSGGEDVLSNTALMALLAGIPLFLIGLGASVLWDQTLGVVRRSRDVRWATTAPVFAIEYRPDGTIVDQSPLTRLLVRQQIPGSVWTIVPVGPSSGVVTLSGALTDAAGDRMESPVGPARPDAAQPVTTRRPAATATPANEADSATDRSPAEVLTIERSAAPTPAGPARSRPAAPPAAVVSGAVVAIIRNDVRLPLLRRAIRELELEGLPVEGVVIFEPER